MPQQRSHHHVVKENVEILQAAAFSSVQKTVSGKTDFGNFIGDMTATAGEYGSGTLSKHGHTTLPKLLMPDG